MTAPSRDSDDDDDDDDAPADNRTARILVVDDDPLSRSLQTRLVGLLGHRALAVERPADAVDLALAGEADLMLLDLSMPEIDGFALLAQLREQEAQRGSAPLPVLAVTGYAAQTDRVRCLMAGFNDHLSKPVDVGTLKAAIDRCLPASTRHAAGTDTGSNDAQRVEATARRLANARPDDRQFGPTVLEAFALRSQNLLEDLQQAAAEGDAAELEHAAVALNASAEFMGAGNMAALCSALQAAAARGDFDRVSALLDSLAAEHATVLSVLLARSRIPRSPG